VEEFLKKRLGRISELIISKGTENWTKLYKKEFLDPELWCVVPESHKTEIALYF
jgi:hypothetical protein